MVAAGFLVFRLIGDSQQGKADARANGLASAAASVYQNATLAARSDARALAADADAAVLSGPALRARLSAVLTHAGLARVTVSEGSRVVADLGRRDAIAPGVAIVRRPGGHPVLTVAVSEVTAGQYGSELAGRGFAVLVDQGGHILSSTLATAPARSLPRQGNVTIGGVTYRAVTQKFSGFGRSVVEVTILSDRSLTTGSLGASRFVAGLFIAGFLLLAFCFSVLASRALQGQIARFLEAARRLGGGDFSSPVPTDGHDEFAALGEEFNSMSRQLARRLDELGEERARLRESIGRIGKTFAANLDRPALLELALNTSMDAVQADSGRLSARASTDEPLAETMRVGALSGLEEQIHDAERAALANGGLGEATAEDVSIVSVALGALEPRARRHGVITLCRAGSPFSDDDRELLRSLSSQATLALENVALHFQLQRQAATDELTGLANHGRFQELLSAEVEEVRRYHFPIGLIMLDIDDFKSINDTHGHPQGDVVLKHVGCVLRESSRDVDVPARYGGEELTLILPHTDLEGTYAIAERVRSAIGGLRVPRLDGEGVLRITASFGVAASADGNKDKLIAAADNALYEAKRQGKNRTVRAPAHTANLFGGE